MKHIQSRDNPFYKSLQKLAKSARERGENGQTLLDGAHLLSACLDAGIQPIHILLNGEAQHDAEICSLLGRIDAVPQTLLDDRLFNALSDLKTPTGVMVLIEIPEPVAAISDARLALLLEDIQDPGNLGSMLRTAAAAGCDSVFLSAGCADAWSPKVLRAGMGGHFVLNVYRNADLIAVADSFGHSVYAAAPDAGTSLYDCDLRGRLAFAVGNEGAGLSASLRSVCRPVSIPMPGRVESLNAAAAAAICLFESVRQRR